MSRRGGSALRGAILMAVSAALLLVWILPVLLSVLTSFKDEKEVLAYPPTVVFEATLKNYVAVWRDPPASCRTSPAASSSRWLRPSCRS